MSAIGAAWRFSLTLVALYLVTAQALAQRQVENPPADYRHSGTNTPFPPSVGRFVRGRVIEYRADGTDASAAYDLARDGQKVLTVTVFIYPAPPGTAACRDEFAGTIASLKQALPAVTPIEAGMATSPRPDLAPAGAHAAFETRAVFDTKEQRVRTDAWVFCPKRGSWLVKYRATGLPEPTFAADVADFMRNFAWSDAVGG